MSARPELRFTRLHYGADTTLTVEAPSLHMGIVKRKQTLVFDMKRKNAQHWPEPRKKSEFPNIDAYIRKNMDKLFPTNTEPVKRALIGPILEGKSDSEIREMFECGRAPLHREKLGIARIVTDAYMKPRELVLLASFGGNGNDINPKTLAYAAKRRALDGVFFLDRWYSTKAAVERFTGKPVISSSSRVLVETS